MPAYLAAQWKVFYVPAAMSVVSITRSPGAPEVCNLSNDDGAAVVVGCIDISGPNLVYSGSAYDVVAECKKDGELQLNLASPDTTKTFVSAGGLNSFETVHTHGDSVICGAGGAVIISPTATPPPTPGPVPTRSVIAGETAAARTVTAVAAGTPAVTPGSPGAAGTPAAGTAQATTAGTPAVQAGTPGAGTPGKNQTPSTRTVVAARTGTPAAGAGVPDGPADTEEDGGFNWVIAIVVVAVALAAVAAGSVSVPSLAGRPPRET